MSEALEIVILFFKCIVEQFIQDDPIMIAIFLITIIIGLSSELVAEIIGGTR